MPTMKLGGPGTCLPRWLESWLCWTLAVSCLSVSGYHYVVGTVLRPLWTRWKQRLLGISSHDGSLIPLVVLARHEVQRLSALDRYQQLQRFLRQAMGGRDPLLSSDDELVSILRSHVVARRLASLAMSDSTSLLVPRLPLGQRLLYLWPRLLALPKTTTTTLKESTISLIVPCYRENGLEIQEKLQLARQAAMRPTLVQVILVDAGHCRELKDVSSEGWGDLQVHVFSKGSGRGPCMNFGASQATGTYLGFLHSDTRLPMGWDERLRVTLETPGVNSCAFGFGIDTSRVGLGGKGSPPGLRAIEVTANLRCHLWSLPYGDQCLCLKASVFDYLGGFPHQCFMEDYDLIALLRLRASRLPESLAIVPGPHALCSPRRWQQYGVWYVTWTNSRLVNRYARTQCTAQDIYEDYYGRPLDGVEESSPWEMEI